jgi:hypothetical protein
VPVAQTAVPEPTPRASFTPALRPRSMEVPIIARMFGPILIKPTEKMPKAKSKLEISALIGLLRFAPPKQLAAYWLSSARADGWRWLGTWFLGAGRSRFWIRLNCVSFWRGCGVPMWMSCRDCQCRCADIGNPNAKGEKRKFAAGANYSVVKAKNRHSLNVAVLMRSPALPQEPEQRHAVGRLFRTPRSHLKTKGKDQTKDPRNAPLASQPARRIMQLAR